MTAYVTITDAQTDPEAPITSELAKQWRDNPIAIAEGVISSPVNSTAWHPYNMISVGDGSNGKFYDNAIDGNVASVNTPTFADGYDYMCRIVGFAGSGANSLVINGVAVATAGTITIDGTIEITAPTLTNYPKWAMVNIADSPRTAGPFSFDGAADLKFLGAFAFSQLALSLTGITIGYSGGNITAGQAFLYRRRNFIFG